MGSVAGPSSPYKCSKIDPTVLVLTTSTVGQTPEPNIRRSYNNYLPTVPTLSQIFRLYYEASNVYRKRKVECNVKLRKSAFAVIYVTERK